MNMMKKTILFFSLVVLLQGVFAQSSKGPFMRIQELSKCLDKRQLTSIFGKIPE